MEKQILEWLWSFWLWDSEANDWEGREGSEGKKMASILDMYPWNIHLEIYSR